MVSPGGFTRHPLDIVTHYSDAFGGEASGFTKLAFALDPGQEDHGWRRVADILRDLLGRGRAVAVVADAMYVMGGISYAEPSPTATRANCRPGQEVGMAEAGDPAIALAGLRSCRKRGSDRQQDVLLGVADYSERAGAEDNTTSTRKPDRMAPRSARLCWFWIRKNLESGWKRLADCPGLPQFDAGVAAAAGKIWRLGGIFGPLHSRPIVGSGQYAYYNAVDSWMYDPVTDPVVSAATTCRIVPTGKSSSTYLDRYVIPVASYGSL